MNYPYFGFQQPNIEQQLMQPNLLSNPATQYMGAMPAGLGGVSASPVASVQQGVTPNMATMGLLGQLGMGLMQQAHPGQRQNIGQQIMPMTMGLMSNPQIANGLLGIFARGQ